MPLYEVKKEYREIVEAADEDDAFRVFDRHMDGFNGISAQETDVDEVKTAAQADRLGYDLDNCIWGRDDDVTLRQYFDAREREAWNRREEVYVIVDGDVGETLAEATPLAKSTEIEDKHVGRVIFRLPDGTYKMETAKQREERIADGHSDREMALEIELAQIKRRLKEVTKDA